VAISNVDLVAAWQDVLTLSKLTAGEQVSLLISDDSNRQVIETARIAIGQMGAILTILTLPPLNGDVALSRDKSGFVGKTPLAGNRTALAALKASDLVIDTMLLLFSPEQAEILQAGARMLLAVEPPEIMLRMKPTAEDGHRATVAATLLGRARVMTVAIWGNIRCCAKKVTSTNPAAGITGRVVWSRPGPTKAAPRVFW